MSKRVFIAIPAGEALRRMFDNYRRRHPDLQVRWLQSRDLHITLLSPWICDDVAAACSLLGDVASTFSPFEICIDNITPGPERRLPRLIWASGKASYELEDLYRCVHDRFSADHAGQLRPFRMHMTFARAKPFALRHVELHMCTPVAELCQRICIYESCLHSSGAVYRKLCCHEFTRDGER